MLKKKHPRYKRQWKSVLSIYVACVTIFLTVIHVQSAEIETKHYIIEDIGVSIDLPVVYLGVFTREIEENDPYLRLIGITKAEIENMMMETDCYLFAEGMDYYLKIYMYDLGENSPLDYRNMSDSEVREDYKNTNYALNNAIGLSIKSPEVYTNRQAKYIKSVYKGELETEKTLTYICEYMTCLAGRKYSIQYVSIGKEISSFTEKEVKDIIDTIIFSINMPLDTNLNSISEDSMHEDFNLETGNSSNRETSDLKKGNIAGIFLNALLTGVILFFLILFLPLCLYRKINAYSIPRGKAKEIVRAYACTLGVLVVVFTLLVKNIVLMIAFLIPIFLWTFAGYKVMQVGRSGIVENKSNKAIEMRPMSASLDLPERLPIGSTSLTRDESETVLKGNKITEIKGYKDYQMQSYCPYCLTSVSSEKICPVCGGILSAYVSDSHHLPVGTILKNQYLVGRVLGEGGFGITYLGKDTVLDRKVAIKEYFPTTFVKRESSVSLDVTCYTGAKKDIYEREQKNFIKEARTIARLDYLAEIVRIMDFFTENCTAYIVMEFLEGTTLKQMTMQKVFSAESLFIMLEPIMRALETMHGKGLIHRDISPDNLMKLKNGKVKLMDFGCARDVQNDQTMTVMLKRGYAPLEQYLGHGQGPWTDVYALCATIYYCLTGTMPPQVMDRLDKDQILESPNSRGANLSINQEQAIMKGLEIQPANRWQSIAELYLAVYGKCVEEKI